MFVEKLAHYGDHLEDMRRRGLRYLPLIFSCYGRAHPNSSATLELIARQAARRVGIGDHTVLLRRARANIGIALWRRAYAMTKACLPRLSREALLLLYGEMGDHNDEPDAALPARDIGRSSGDGDATRRGQRSHGTGIIHAVASDLVPTRAAGSSGRGGIRAAGRGSPVADLWPAGAGDG
jgi:hypothetical protein